MSVGFAAFKTDAERQSIVEAGTFVGNAVGGFYFLAVDLQVYVIDKAEMIVQSTVIYFLGFPYAVLQRALFSVVAGDEQIKQQALFRVFAEILRTGRVRQYLLAARANT